MNKGVRCIVVFMTQILFTIVALWMQAAASGQAEDIHLADTPWPTHQHDNQRTGRSPYLGITATAGIRWQRVLTTPLPGNGGLTAGLSGTVYVRGLWATVVFDQDGNLVRSYPYGGTCESDPTLTSNGSLYIGGTWNYYAIAGNGDLLWYLEFPYGCLQSTSAITDGVLYITIMKTLYALDAVDGSGMWAYPIAPDALFAGGTVAVGHDGTVYAPVGYESGLVAVNPDGTLRWQTNGGISNPAIGDDDTIYNPGDGVLTAFRPDGSIKWTFSFSESVCSYTSPAIAQNGTIYLPTSNTRPSGERTGDEVHLYAINPDGVVRWAYPIEMSSGHGICSSPITDRESNVYFCTDSGKCYGLSQDGALLWKILLQEGTWLRISPVISSDGTMYVAGDVGGSPMLYSLVGLSSRAYLPLIHR